MQRRAAAVYFALFVLIGAGTFAFIQVGTSQPGVRLDAGTLTKGESLTVGGTEYTVTKIGHEGGGGGGHGGGGSGPILATVSWTNESYVATATLDDNSTMTYRGASYRVDIPNESGVSEFELVETFNVTAMLMTSDAVEDTLATKNGTKYVVYRSNDSLRALSAWLPEPSREGPFAEGDTMQYQTDDGNVSARVRSVTPSVVTLAWDSSKDRTAELTEGGNVTLQGTQYFAHFTDAKHVQLVPTDKYWDAYMQDRNYQDAWFERHAGLWAVVIASFMAAVLLLAAAYMPVKS